MRRTPGRTKATWLARLAVVVVAVAAYVWALPAAFGGSSDSSSNGYAYGNAYGQDRVPVCHDGETIDVALPSVAAHLAHGDTAGPCP